MASLPGGVLPTARAQRPMTPGAPQGAWASVVPTDSISAQQLKVAPEWPANRFIIASDHDRERERQSGSGDGSVSTDVIRSFDGGSNWDRIEVSGIRLGSLVVAPLTPSGRIIFGVNARLIDNRTAEFSIVRSGDGGATWSPAFAAPARLAAPGSLLVSPTFADDGHVFAIQDGLLYRSQDFGVTWSQLSLGDGQRVQQIELSRAFASDRTVVAAMVTGRFPTPWDRVNDVRTVPHHESSAGVMVSTDGGDSWRASSVGLELHGVPFRYVQQIALSPSFDRDGVLFACAWGPWTGSAVAAALFRSGDRGLSWSPVWETAEGQAGLRWSAAFALSPAFGVDNFGQMTLVGISSYNASPHSTAACRVYSTADGGKTWLLVPRARDRSPGCASLSVRSGGPTGRVSYSLVYPGEGARASAYRSYDDGATWDFVEPPYSSVPGTGYWPFVVAADGMLLVGTYDGIWALGP